MQFDGKFTTLKMFKDHPLIGRYIPDFVVLLVHDQAKAHAFLKGRTCIMRSALSNESTEHHLLAGKGLSIPHIQTPAQCDEAMSRLFSQSSIAEVILQDERRFDDHITAYVETNFVFANIRHMKSGKIDTCILTPHTRVGSFSNNLVSNFLDEWNTVNIQGPLLLELGVNSTQVSLFQAVSIPSSIIQRLFNDDLLKHILQARERWTRSRTLWGLLSTEWNAYRFRQKSFSSSETVGDAFENWHYLFHYFYIFCRRHHRSGNGNDFADFLSSIYQSHSPARRHIEIAAILRHGEYPAAFLSHESGPYFIGQGQIQGNIGLHAFLVVEPMPEQIYALSEARVILTSSKNILGHAILAAVERGIPIIANLPEKQLHDLQATDSFSINFESHEFVIQS